MPYHFYIVNKKTICVIIKIEGFVKMMQLEKIIDEFTKESINMELVSNQAFFETSGKTILFY